MYVKCILYYIPFNIESIRKQANRRQILYFFTLKFGPMPDTICVAYVSVCLSPK